MSAPMDTTGDEKVDEALYSRQLYVFGHEAQRRMGQTNVLIVGMKGLGVETAKNVILAGVKSVGILDNSNVEIGDLSAQFYLTPADVGKRTRAEASLAQLTELNNYVRVTQVIEELSQQVIEKGQYHVVVLTERLVSEQLRIGDYCHAHGIKFITADVRGAFVSVFVDLGDEHIVSDPDGEQPLRGLISHVSNSTVGVVTCHDESRHGLSNGDLVTFEEVEGMTQLNGCPPQPVRVISPYSFSIGDTSSFGTYTGTKGYFQQVKAAKTLKFQPLSAVIKKPEIVSDFVGTAAALHCIYNALSAFQEQNGGRLPQAHVDTDANAVVKLAQSFASTMESKTEIDEKWAFQVARCAAAHLNALAAIGGGIVGQEVLKASSGKFGPIQQFYYFDGTSMLPAPVTDLSIYAPQNSRYDSQIMMFGRDIHHTLTQTSYFLVGAGAIGCEMLKNFAMMGIATNGKGRVHVTDMDTIELSNLNRQFLFRPSDVGQLKSVAAARESVKMNPDMRVDAQSLRVSPQTEDVYDDTFWESLNGVITALDNVEARIYVDQRCIYYQKPMIDSGTLGTKGSTQVIVPFMTESYGSSRDPAEESIPICTLKNFPNKIEHTIQWARDHFEGDFKQGPEEVNNYLSNPNYLTELAKQPNVQLQNLTTIHNYLVAQKPITFEQCIEWARAQFEIEFNHKIRQLLSVFPPDAKTAEGAAFWSGPKRPPTPLTFSSSDPLHLDFIIAASNLRAFNYGLKAPENSPAYYQRVLETVKVPEYVNQQVKIATTDSEHKQLAETVDDDHDQKVRAAVEKLPSPSSLAGYRLNPIEFEKDNDANFHIAYIAATSNLRARNYAIKEESRHQTKFIAGKIIPAIATTTALVTGLVCVEIYKLIQKKVLEQYRNYTVNLALPLFASAEPIAPATQTITLKGKEWKWSLWDRIDVDQGDMTLEQFIKYFDTEYGLEVTMLSHGRAMLYYSFGAAQKKIKQRLPMKMSQVVETVGQITLNPKTKYLVLEVTVADESGEDIEIPYVRFKFRS